MRIDIRAAKCFVRLQAEEFRPLVDFLTAMRDEKLASLVKATDVVMIHRLQGQVSQIDELLITVRDSRAITEKLGG
jgi:hypothetical protein